MSYSYVSPIGQVNFTTGKNALFGNVFYGWEEDENDTYLLCEEMYGNGKTKFKAIITCDPMESAMTHYKVGDELWLRHDQTWAHMGTWKVIGLYRNTKEGLLEMKARTGRSGCPFATFK